MKKTMVVMTIATLTGCSQPYQHSNNSYNSSGSESTVVLPKPKKAIGWDKTGHLMYEGQTETAKVEIKKDIIDNKLAGNSPSIKTKNSKKYTKKEVQEVKNEVIEKTVILNEDTIICENETELVPSVIEDNDILNTGTNLISWANSSIHLSESYAKTIEIHQQYLNKLNSIGSSTNSLNARLSIDSINDYKDKLSQRENSVKHAKDFLRACTLTKESQIVTVIESKPVSNISKINVKLNGSTYGMWTYTNHLTIN